MSALKKFLIINLAGVVFLTNGPLLYAQRVNFWSQRREALISPTRLARLPGEFRPVSPHGVRELTPARLRFQPPQISPPGSPLTSVLTVLSRSEGTIRNIRTTAKNEKIVLLIQDVHRNTEAQTHISRTLTHLIQTVPVSLLALEGTTGSIDLSRLRAFPHPWAIKKVADYLFKEKEISGPLYTALTSPKEIPTFIGVDEKKLYDANVEAYRKSTRVQKLLKTGYARARKRLKEKKLKTYNPDLKNFDQGIAAYQMGRLSFSAYVKNLLNAVSLPRGEDIRRTSPSLPLSSPAPAEREFLDALRLESSIDFPRVNAERAHLLARLVEKMEEKSIRHLSDLAIAYKIKTLSAADFYSSLKILAKNHGIAPREFPEINKYSRYVRLTAQMNGEKLLRETRDLQKKAFAQLARTPKEKTLIAQSRRLYLVGKLLNFSLSKEEWKEVKKTVHHDSLAAPDDLSFPPLPLLPFEKFYELAEKRDRAMARNFLTAIARRPRPESRRRQLSVLVSGGFHSNEISKRLNKAGFTVISYAPRITQIARGEETASLGVFTQEKSPLEELFEGQKLFLAPNPVTGLNKVPLLTSAYFLNQVQNIFNQLSPVKAVVHGAKLAKDRIELRIEYLKRVGKLVIRFDDNQNIVSTESARESRQTRFDGAVMRGRHKRDRTRAGIHRVLGVRQIPKSVGWIALLSFVGDVWRGFPAAPPAMANLVSPPFGLYLVAIAVGIVVFKRLFRKKSPPQQDENSHSLPDPSERFDRLFKAVRKGVVDLHTELYYTPPIDDANQALSRVATLLRNRQPQNSPRDQLTPRERLRQDRLYQMIITLQVNALLMIMAQKERKSDERSRRLKMVMEQQNAILAELLHRWIAIVRIDVLEETLRTHSNQLFRLFSELTPNIFGVIEIDSFPWDFVNDPDVTPDIIIKTFRENPLRMLELLQEDFQFTQWSRTPPQTPRPPPPGTTLFSFLPLLGLLSIANREALLSTVSLLIILYFAHSFHVIGEGFEKPSPLRTGEKKSPDKKRRRKMTGLEIYELIESHFGPTPFTRHQFAKVFEKPINKVEFLLTKLLKTGVLTRQRDSRRPYNVYVYKLVPLGEETKQQVTFLLSQYMSQRDWEFIKGPMKELLKDSDKRFFSLPVGPFDYTSWANRLRNPSSPVPYPPLSIVFDLAMNHFNGQWVKQTALTKAIPGIDQDHLTGALELLETLGLVKIDRPPSPPLGRWIHVHSLKKGTAQAIAKLLEAYSPYRRTALAELKTDIDRMGSKKFSSVRTPLKSRTIPARGRGLTLPYILKAIDETRERTGHDYPLLMDVAATLGHKPRHVSSFAQTHGVDLRRLGLLLPQIKDIPKDKESLLRTIREAANRLRQGDPRFRWMPLRWLDIVEELNISVSKNFYSAIRNHNINGEDLGIFAHQRYSDKMEKFVARYLMSLAVPPSRANIYFVMHIGTPKARELRKTHGRSVTRIDPALKNKLMDIEIAWRKGFFERRRRQRDEYITYLQDKAAALYLEAIKGNKPERRRVLRRQLVTLAPNHPIVSQENLKTAEIPSRSKIYDYWDQNGQTRQSEHLTEREIASEEGVHAVIKRLYPTPEKNLKPSRIFEIGGEDPSPTRSFLLSEIKGKSLRRLIAQKERVIREDRVMTYLVDFPRFLTSTFKKGAPRAHLIYSIRGVRANTRRFQEQEEWNSIFQSLSEGGRAVIQPAGQEAVFDRDPLALTRFAAFAARHGVLLERVFTTSNLREKDKRIFVLRKTAQSRTAGELSLGSSLFYKRYVAGFESIPFGMIPLGLPAFGFFYSLGIFTTAFNGPLAVISALSFLAGWWIHEPLFLALHRDPSQKEEKRQALRQLRKVLFKLLLVNLIVMALLRFNLWLSLVLPTIGLVLAHFTNDWIYLQRKEQSHRPLRPLLERSQKVRSTSTGAHMGTALLSLTEILSPQKMVNGIRSEKITDIQLLRPPGLLTSAIRKAIAAWRHQTEDPSSLRRSLKLIPWITFLFSAPLWAQSGEIPVSVGGGTPPLLIALLSSLFIIDSVSFSRKGTMKKPTRTSNSPVDERVEINAQEVARQSIEEGFFSHLKAARERQQWTLETLSQKATIQKNRLENFEKRFPKGLKSPTPQEIQRLSATLDISLSKLLTGLSEKELMGVSAFDQGNRLIPSILMAKIRVIRNQRGLSIGAIARLLDLTKKAYSAFDHGQHLLKPHQIKTLSDTLGVDMGVLLAGRPTEEYLDISFESSAAHQTILGRKLIILRYKAGLNTRNVAQKIHDSTREVGLLEKAKRQPNRRHIFMLPNLYGISIRKIFGSLEAPGEEDGRKIDRMIYREVFRRDAINSDKRQDPLPVTLEGLANSTFIPRKILRARINANPDLAKVLKETSLSPTSALILRTIRQITQTHSGNLTNVQPLTIQQIARQTGLTPKIIDQTIQENENLRREFVLYKLTESNIESLRAAQDLWDENGGGNSPFMVRSLHDISSRIKRPLGFLRKQRKNNIFRKRLNRYLLSANGARLLNKLKNIPSDPFPARQRAVIPNTLLAKQAKLSESDFSAEMNHRSLQLKAEEFLRKRDPLSRDWEYFHLEKVFRAVEKSRPPAISRLRDLIHQMEDLLEFEDIDQVQVLHAEAANLIERIEPTIRKRGSRVSASLDREINRLLKILAVLKKNLKNLHLPGAIPDHKTQDDVLNSLLVNAGPRSVKLFFRALGFVTTAVPLHEMGHNIAHYGLWRGSWKTIRHPLRTISGQSLVHRSPPRAVRLAGLQANLSFGLLFASLWYVSTHASVTPAPIGMIFAIFAMGHFFWLFAEGGLSVLLKRGDLFEAGVKGIGVVRPLLLFFAQRYVNFFSQEDPVSFQYPPNAFLVLGTPDIKTYVEFARRWQDFHAQTPQDIPVPLESTPSKSQGAVLPPPSLLWILLLVTSVILSMGALSSPDTTLLTGSLVVFSVLFTSHATLTRGQTAGRINNRLPVESPLGLNTFGQILPGKKRSAPTRAKGIRRLDLWRKKLKRAA